MNREEALQWLVENVTAWPIDFIELPTRDWRWHRFDGCVVLTPESSGRIISKQDWKAALPVATPSKPVTTNDIITERGNRYGLFSDGSVIMQNLKNVMRDTPNWEGLRPSQREALEMIQHKIGRILNGDPDYDDNWIDIAGYSTLVLEELRGNKR